MSETILADFSIKQSVLLPALQLVIGAVEKKQSMEILSHIWFDVTANRLALLATDLEVELEAFLTEGLTVDKPGQFTIPGRKMMEICRSLPDEAEIKITVQTDKVMVRSGRSRFNLLARDVNDFPRIDVEKNHLEFTLFENSLLTLLQATHFAISQQDVRYFFNGALFALNDNTIDVVATNGHRLAKATLSDLPLNLPEMQAIIPRKSVLELMRLLTPSGAPLTISLSDNHIRLQSDRFCLTSKLIEGIYPDYRRAIPSRNHHKIVISNDLLKQALARVSILSSEKTRGVYLELRPQKLNIIATNAEREDAEEVIEVDYEGDALDLGFNVTYLIEALNALPAGEVNFYFNDATSGVLLDSDSSPHSLYVVMPMKF